MNTCTTTSIIPCTEADLVGMVLASNSTVVHHPVWKLDGVKIIHKVDEYYAPWQNTYFTFNN